MRDYSPSFLTAIETILEHEGVGYDARDPGGATRYGISLAFLQDADELGFLDGDLDGDGDVDAADVAKLDRAGAVEIYFRQWWGRYGYDRLPLQIGIKVFDLAVNMGPGWSHRLLQRALHAVGREVAIDGGLGPETLGAVEATMVEDRLPELLAALRSEAAGHYRAVLKAHPDREWARRGWMRRAYDLPG